MGEMIKITIRIRIINIRKLIRIRIINTNKMTRIRTSQASLRLL